MNGCDCNSNCTGRVDKVHDSCSVDSSCPNAYWDLFNLGYRDCCAYSADQEYEAQTWSTKLTHLWTKVLADDTPAAYPNAVGLFNESVWTSFANVSDEIVPARSKYIHSSGWTGKFKFVPVKSKYTGVFESETEGLLRVSFAKPWAAANITPGLGIKFLRTGVPSCNFMAMPSLDGQTEQSFFVHPFDNHLAPPSPTIPNKLILKKFNQASTCPQCVGISNCARFDADGQEVQTPLFPFRLSLVSELESPTDNASARDYDEFFAGFKEGTKIFEVYAYDSPADYDYGTRSKIGQIIAQSSYLTSSYGDQNLFFKHDWFEEDLQRRPEWKDQFNEKNNCGVNCDTKIPNINCS